LTDCANADALASDDALGSEIGSKQLKLEPDTCDQGIAETGLETRVDDVLHIGLDDELLTHGP
jgi:hypothetical protein